MPVEPWPGVRSSLEFGPRCTQVPLSQEPSDPVLSLLAAAATPREERTGRSSPGAHSGARSVARGKIRPNER